MKPLNIPDDLEQVANARILVAREVAIGEVRLRKGRQITEDDLRALRSVGAAGIRALRLDEGDLDEATAARRIAAAAAGACIKITGDPVEGSQKLTATRRGIFRVDVARLHAINSVPAVGIFSRYDGLPVDEGEAVAHAKVGPLGVPAAVVESVERIALDGPALEVTPFEPRFVRLLNLEALPSTWAGRFESQFRERVAWFGSDLAPIRHLPEADIDGVRDAVTAAVRAETDVLLITGTRSTDPLDEGRLGALAAGARLIREGLPAHPGSTYWVASLEGKPVIGIASCGTLSDSTALDLLLPRVFAGLPVDADYLASLGHGGMLTSEMQFRFPKYLRRSRRGEV